jgi:hypothetical protein
MNVRDILLIRIKPTGITKVRTKVKNNSIRLNIEY